MQQLHALLFCAVAGVIIAASGSLRAQRLDPKLPSSAANTSTSWTNSADDQIRYGDGSVARVVLLSDSAGASNDAPAFACGFLCGPACDHRSFLFGVFLVTTNSAGDVVAAAPRHVTVWSANRDRPVPDNATLQLTDAGDLVLHSADGAFVWSTNTSGLAVAGVRLADSGDLVLFDNRSFPVWQSFDHPTDVLVPGQYLRPGMRLTANASAANVSEGSLYVSAGNDGLSGFVGHDPPQLYFTAPVSNSMKLLANITFLNGSISAFGQSSSSSSPEIMISLPVARSVQFIRVESDGHMRLYGWNLSSWVFIHEVLHKYIAGDCEYPMACGSYGICSGAGRCSCPETYFRRASLRCEPINPISCQNTKNITMVKLPDVTYFNYDGSGAIVHDKVTQPDCLSGCLANCSCKAAYFKTRVNDTNGTCFLQSQLFSLQELQTAVPSLYNSEAFIKVVQIIKFAMSRPPMKKTFGTGMLMGITIGSVALILSIALLITMRKCRQREDGDHIEHLPGMPRKFSFEELKLSTWDFSKKIGEGASGIVFEGVIENESVAVKRLESVARRKEEFLSEVQTIGSIHHVNLVRMIGYCIEKSHRLLVYEFMSNGSLDRWVFDEQESPFDWRTRHKIVSDVARGLCYLHEGCRQRIVHLDIKPQNILLDDQFNAKLSDFGLAKLVDRDKSRVMTRMRGTPGYLAPEWLTSTITEKADVYSFGVVVMEVMCGRRNLDHSQPEEAFCLMRLLQENARNDKLLDMIDRRMEDMQLHSEDVMRMMRLAMWCLQLDSNRRPSMSTVLKVLEDASAVQENLDFNFVITSSSIFREGCLDESDLPSSSVLSGPR